MRWTATILLLLSSVAGTRVDADERSDVVEIWRDRWGIPHIFADTDAGAMYGLGYATAEDRGFQMHLTLRIIQGRLAEIIGDIPRTGRDETAAQYDRKMRTFGYYPAAQQVAANLDRETRDLLEAYSAGVNVWFEEQHADRHFLFQQLELTPQPWTPADSIAVWWHLAKFFGPDGTRDLNAYRAAGERATAALPTGGDEDAAVVQREDVSDEWVERTNTFARRMGILTGPHTGRALGSSGEDAPRFSHAWVIGGEKSTTGSAVLVSDPQTLVANPALFYEFHVRGETFDARGIGVPGSPIILIGFSPQVAWGMTALGADQADLFRLQTDPHRPDQYLLDGQWRAMEVSDETIRVKDAASLTFRSRSTRFGPVVTDYVFARPDDGEFALRRVPICDSQRETVQGAIAMLRARDVAQFAEALGGWRFPSANAVFGDRHGNIGYRAIGALPVRSRHAVAAGRFPHDGSRSEHDWQGVVPHELMPHVVNPTRGFLFSANHRPIGSFYPIPIGNNTGSMGETLRSWRLRELIAGQERFAPEEVLAIHYDDVNPARRDIVRLGFHLRDTLRHEVSPGARLALEHLAEWQRAGSPSNLTVRGAALAAKMDLEFRRHTTDLTVQYGGGDSGQALWLKAVRRRLSEDPESALTKEEAAYVIRVLDVAWQQAVAGYGPDPDAWLEQARRVIAEERIGYYVNLDGFPSLDPAQDLPMPALTSVDRATIRSQQGQAYTQFVPLHDVDQSQSLLPPGQAERPGSESRTATLQLWETGRLHPAPLSRVAIEPHVRSRKTILLRPAPAE